MNKKIFFLMICNVFFSNQLHSMQKTSKKLNWSQLWNKFLGKKQINPEVVKVHQKILKNYNTLTLQQQVWFKNDFEKLQKIFTIIKQQPQDPVLNALFPLLSMFFSNKLDTFKADPKLYIQKNIDEISNLCKEFETWFSKLSFEQKEQYHPVKQTFELIIPAIKNINQFDFENGPIKEVTEGYDILTKSRTLANTVNQYIRPLTITPEVLALQHFQSTKAPSNMNVPIYDRTFDESFTSGSNSVASYSLMFACINLSKGFHDESPSNTYRTLIHEYRHHLQAINIEGSDTTELKNLNNKSAVKFYPKSILEKANEQIDNPSWLIYERDADNFSAEHISCPTCLKVISINTYLIKSPLIEKKGYFSYADWQPFIQRAKNNQCCPAHTKTPGDEQHNSIVNKLEQCLTQVDQVLNPQNITQKLDLLFLSSEFKKMEIMYLGNDVIKLDKQCGNLLQHIPNYNQDFIRSIAEIKSFQELLGAKLLKELDVRNTMQQTQAKTQIGQYPQIEANSYKPQILAPD